MDLLAHIPAGAAGLLVAAAAVVAGGPLFAAGLRAYRLRHALSGLHERPLERDASGLVLVRGTVSLESPLFAPLSGKPCAGYTLEVSGEGMRVGGSVAELRPFRLYGGAASARVVPERARWLGPVTHERTLQLTEAVPARLSELMVSSPELNWLLDRHVPLRLVERALEVGREVFVTGVARSSGAIAGLEQVELAATGTEGRAMAAAASEPGRIVAEPELWIEADEPLGRVLVSGEVPAPVALSPARWRLALLALGPALTLAGLLHLAVALGPLLAGTS